MATEGTKSVHGIEVVAKKSRLRELWYKLQSLVARRKLLFLTGLFIVIFGLGLFVYRISHRVQEKTVPVENQQVDQAAADAALKKVQENPSAIPSGKFHPEKGDYFRTGDDGTSNSGAVQQ